MKKGYGVFGKAYEVMFRNDMHDEDSIDHYILRNMTKYLKKNNRADFIEKYELSLFVMPIQTMGRTIIDKLFAICDYHLQKSIIVTQDTFTIYI